MFYTGRTLAIVGLASKYPILLVHGALSDSRVWKPQTDGLAAEGLIATAITLDGFGSQVSPGDNFTADDNVAQLCAILGSEPGRFHLVGHSRGGRIALSAASRVPDAVASLVVVEAGGAREADFLDPSRAVPVSASDVTQVVTALLDAGEDERAVRHYIAAGHGKEAWASLPDALREIFVENAHSLRSTMFDRTAPLSRATAAAVICPTLLVEGGKSPPLFHAVADVLAATIPDQRRRRIADGDHFMLSKQPATFNAELTEFIRLVEA